MSVQPEEREAIELPHRGDVAFGALMDALAPESTPEATPGDGSSPAAGAGDAGGSEAQPAAGAAGAAAGSPDTSGGGDAATGPADAGQPGAGSGAPAGAEGAAAGSAGQPAAPDAGAAVPATWTATADEYLPKLGELSTKFEENVTKAFQQQAYEQAREDYEKYFEALEKHPRLLVGTQVPAIGKEGMEVLRNSEDAKEWQEAVRSLLVQEIRENATGKMEESQDYLQTIHSSIDLFKNNRDLIPGTKDFNRRLADQFAAMMTPYEVRVEGKLQGYSIPVQPIIDNLRTNLKTAAVPSPGTAAAPPAVAPSPRPASEPPQAGIPSKSGNSSDKEDFSTLFGTIGLPNLQI